MAELRRWQVEGARKEHVVEYSLKLAGDGEASVDGKIVAAWGSNLSGLPKEVQFEIEGKPATLRRTGAIAQHFDLVYEGKVYTQKEGKHNKGSLRGV